MPRKTKEAKENGVSGGAEGGQAKNADRVEPDSIDQQPSGSRGSTMTPQTVMELAAHLQSLTTGTAARDLNSALSHQYNFWNTQPVPKLNEVVEENTHIEEDLQADQIRSEPFSLPDAFEWSDVDLNDVAQLTELYTLLTENYVEDDDNMFRFDYSADFLKWALLVPGWLPQWHCGVRAKATKRLVAFISAVPQKIRVYDKTKQMVEINFLCVHKKLRQKRVAPVLIREITRRVNQQGIFQAAFTAGVVLPKPVAVCRYYHRSLNPKKLIECKFSSLSPKSTMLRTIKLYKLPDDTKSTGLRVMEKKDIEGAHKLLNCHLEKYNLAPVFDQKEFEHIFLPRDDVIYSYVLEEKGQITDMISFYSLPSSVMQNPQHKKINAAYSYYNVATTVPFKQLMNDALIIARKAGFDVFNALDLMANKEVLEELKFGIGDGNLQYYLYNWKCPEMKPNQVGLVLQ
ncbi:unnamed protein product, partial [Mesorhabditis belari]|uniref:Glycylpeptide N-tetradecanoyltransferase n=1 Tax=Mesorhabditis belari TaxID=2138241 RepID=A0AAF3J475_9BILA